MCAFAGNSLLCRAALANTTIDPASFTAIRLASGAAFLSLLVAWQRKSISGAGSWCSATLLFLYAAAFSYAYISLSAATGALLLFGAVQITMIGVGFSRGERLTAGQVTGAALALAGLIGLLLPGITAPEPLGAMLMVAAGIAWGGYSLRGRHATDATLATTGNFIRTLPLAALLMLLASGSLSIDATGTLLAIASGALASGLGYALWYAALPYLRASSAATVQLSVPVITALAGALLLSEPISLRLAIASIVTLGGIAMVIHYGRARSIPNTEPPQNDK
ncbi:EamA family transporter [Microbulbifer flavimaris]|uniref:EamA family transporter n=1 Tax=Microbulbifer flavimaris TaxID=1781068 RepID=A0ABX4HZT5_9GAMM|nr:MULTISPECIES: DMT family transporter [Microbulbifer]PCO04834.1 EamA family transporter [Microbulbifer flavimaris]